MAADYQKLAQNVDATADAMEHAAKVVDDLERSLFTMAGRVDEASKKYAEAEEALGRAMQRQQFAQSNGVSGNALAPFVNAVQQAAASRDQAGKKLQEQQQTQVATAPRTAPGPGQTATVPQLSQQPGQQGGQQPGATGGGPAPQPDGGGSGLSALPSAALGAFSDALGAVVPILGGMGAALGQFVGAFSPALMEQFSMAMKDVTAVIGQALAPVLQVLTGIVREVGAVLNPVMKELQPVFDKLAKALASLLVPIIENAAAMLQTLLPIITLLADALTALTPLFRVLSVLQAGLVELFKDMMASLLGSVDTKGAMASFKSAMEETAKVLIRTAAHIARAFGALGFIEGMIKGIEGKTAKKQSSVGMAAPQGATVTDLSGYGNTVATAAFAATGDLGDKEKKTEEWLKDIAGDLKGIKTGPSMLMQKLEELQGKVEVWITEDLPKAIAAALKTPAYEAGVDLASYANPATFLVRKFFKK